MRPELPSLTVYRGASSWMLDCSGALDAADVFQAFGTYTIPLPWTLGAEGLRVAVDIAGRYPDHVVTLRRAAGVRLNDVPMGARALQGVK